MILIILAFWFGYKKARDSDRNPWLWAAISGGVFIGAQLIVGLAAGVLIAIGQQVWGWDQKAFDNYMLLANIPAIIFSVVALWLVFRFLDSRPPEEVNDAPPPPPTFGQSV